MKKKFQQTRIKDKKILISFLIVLGILFAILTIFKMFNYKKIKTGNNITNKTLQEIESYILNINSYDAEIEINVESNKNQNKYVIKQKYASPNICCQEVLEPKNIEGLKIKYNGNKLEITNSKLNLSTIYENYQYLSDNVLWLSDFIENYKIYSGTISERDGIIVMETKCKGNSYISSEKLYIDRNANKITKLVIEDKNNNAKIYITYKEIKIDSLSPDNVLAFKIEGIDKVDI